MPPAPLPSGFNKEDKEEEQGYSGHSRKILGKLRDMRKAKIHDMVIRCETQQTIARQVNCSQTTVSNIVNEIRQESKHNLQQYLTEHLPLAHSIAMSGVDMIIVELWRSISEGTQQGTLKVSDKTDILGLLLHSYSQRLEMSANGELVGEAMRQMDMVRQQLLELRPDIAQEIQGRMLQYQQNIANSMTGGSGGVVTPEGERRQEQVLKNQQTLEELQEEEENLDDDNVRENSKSSADSVLSSTTHLEEQSQNNENNVSLPDRNSSSSIDNGNGKDKSHHQQYHNKTTRNKVF